MPEAYITNWFAEGSSIHIIKNTNNRRKITMSLLSLKILPKLD